MSAAKHSKRALQIIQDEIKQIRGKQGLTAKDLGIKPGDFRMDVTKTEEMIIAEQVEDFVLQNNAVLSALGYDLRKVGEIWRSYEENKGKCFNKLDYQTKFIIRLVEKLRVPVHSVIQSRNWIMDYDEMFLVDRKCTYQSPVSLYTQEPTNNITDSNDDIIIIRPKFSQ